MTYAFTFDSSACSGCKACQEACKDKNNLPVGVMWRRVIEVTGGEWENVGARSPRPEINDANRVGEPNPYVWTNNVFAYNLSIACNHCVHPKCAGVCPTDAYVHRADGIVYIDPDKCMGCGYCSWACPYNAPRYNPELGQMAKCNFCFDNIDAGLPPSCVAACPMRVLGFAEVKSEKLSVRSDQFSELWNIPASEHPFPLSINSRTEPHLMVKPHVAMNNSLEKRISNYEEIRPKHQKSEMPLVAFTLLVQIAIGMFWMVLLTYYLMPNKHNMGQIIFMPMLFSEICIFCALVISFLHLGTPKNAWKIIYHLQKSWLSREILSVVAFAAFGFLTTYWGGLVYGNISMRYSFYGLMHWDLVKHCFTGELLCNFIYPSILPFYWLASITFCIGILSTFSMAKVYRLHVMPAWDTWRTTVGFFVTAILLGQLAMNNLLGGSRLAWGVVVAALAFELALVLSAKPKAEGLGTSIRVGLSAAGMLGAGIMLFASNPIGVWVSPVLFLLVMIEEVIGRVQFYTVLDEKPL